MKENKLEIFEPALCCETGVCGVSVDSEILRINGAVNALKSAGYSVNRYNLNSTPMVFVTNSIINQYINEHGAEGLPVTVLNDEIIVTKKYIDNAQLAEIFGVKEESLHTREESCCADESCYEHQRRAESGGCGLC